MSVLWQQVEHADDVEAPLEALPQADPPGWVRRWLWAPALGVALALYVVRRQLENPSGELELWLFMGMLAAAMVGAVACLVRYRDDQRRGTEQAAARAFDAGARSVTGSVLVRERATSSGRLLSGLLSYPTDDGTAEQTWSAMLPARSADEQPGEQSGERSGERSDDETAGEDRDGATARVPLPPRDGDPVAVWWAPGTDVVVARYHRGWAESVRRRTRGR
ncbi:hypothetical protein LEP48_03125 [Isoptericola sp. NEAU-Y5]|uniref:Uncharacterized protein n=1 Tax=Isoptericola luteus TaxID=2879484 RepID=A0ABS7ZBB8_9MICO|nr:hypothetical protein [Isoptericola sp. NEAU-Y5]MCA5892343.1 hypothetical protein [Isoptericola sp. NEAU-Y5]